MNFHLPKPLHGWRSFAGEVGIIVLGVLIALGFGQIVQEWQWHRDVGTARQAIADELADSAGQGAERLSIEDCLRDRIGELSGKLNANTGQWTADPLPTAGRVPPEPHWDNRSMGRVYSVPLRGWSQDAWDTAKSTGALGHMRHDEVASYSAIYAEIDKVRDLQAQELPLESKVSFLSVDQRLGDSARTDALATLGQLDALNAVIAGLSSLMIDQIKGLHLHVDRARRSEALKRSIDTERQFRGGCVKDVEIQY
jgi:hypothetical protein